MAPSLESWAPAAWEATARLNVGVRRHITPLATRSHGGTQPFSAAISGRLNSSGTGYRCHK